MSRLRRGTRRSPSSCVRCARTAERGELLDQVRARYDDWLARLVLVVGEMHEASEKRSERGGGGEAAGGASAGAAARQQVDEPQDGRAAPRAGLEPEGGDSKVEFDQKLAWKGLKGMAVPPRPARPPPPTSSSKAEAAAAEKDGRFETLHAMFEGLVDELSPSQVAKLLYVVLEEEH